MHMLEVFASARTRSFDLIWHMHLTIHIKADGIVEMKHWKTNLVTELLIALIVGINVFDLTTNEQLSAIVRIATPRAHDT